MMRRALPPCLALAMAIAWSAHAQAPAKFRFCMATLEGHGPLTIATMTCGEP